MEKSIDNVVKQINGHCEISIHKHFMPHQGITTHWHDYFEFEMVLEGSYDHIFNGTKYISRTGDAWIMSYSDYHALKPLEDSKIINIGFSPDYISGDISDFISSHSGIILTFDDDTRERIYSECMRLMQEVHSENAFSRTAAVSLLQDILITTLRICDKSRHMTMPSGVVQSAASFLHKNYKYDTSLTTVADKCYVSPGHLSFLFKKTFGMSYNSYVNRIRMKHACDMLSSSGLAIKDIARECGYNSQEHFFYTFKKLFGCTPLDYRTKNK